MAPASEIPLLNLTVPILVRDVPRTVCRLLGFRERQAGRLAKFSTTFVLGPWVLVLGSKDVFCFGLSSMTVEVGWFLSASLLPSMHDANHVFLDIPRYDVQYCWLHLGLRYKAVWRICTLEVADCKLTYIVSVFPPEYIYTHFAHFRGHFLLEVSSFKLAFWHWEQTSLATPPFEDYKA